MISDSFTVDILRQAVVDSVTVDIAAGSLIALQSIIAAGCLIVLQSILLQAL